MPTGARLRLIKGVLYRLKRSYGCPLAVYKQTPETIDLATGRSSISRTSVEIKRAIVLPAQMHRGFTYDIGYLKANSNFTYGGIFTDATRQIIIDRSDLPKDFALDATDQFYIVYQGKRWELKTVAEFEFKTAYSILATRVDGAIVNEITNVALRERLEFHETIGGGNEVIEFLNPTHTLGFNQTVSVTIPVHNRSILDSLKLTDGVT